MMVNNKTKAASWGAGAALKTKNINTYTKPPNAKAQLGIPRDWLPPPFFYYKKIFPRITHGTEWVNVHCCFHNDSNPSLSLNLKSGGYFCHACGAKGGDVLSFHMRKNQMTFKATVAALSVKKEAK